MLDELPSLEFAATAVALLLVLRAAQLSPASRGDAGLLRRGRRTDSGRARDLVGIVIIAGAALYAVGVERASTWFLVACGVAIVAQLVSFYFRTAARSRATAEPTLHVSADGDDEGADDDELHGCPNCGHGTLIELDDTARLLGGLNQLTPVTAVVCPRCGALSGHVEDAAKIPVGEQHGTSLRKSPSGEDAQALQEPTEHDG